MDEIKIKELVSIAKQFLSIIEKATLKDKEIVILVKAAVFDMETAGIEIEKNIDNELIIETIMMHVKANFGNTNINEKELSQKRYKSNMSKIVLCSEFKKEAINE